MPAPKTAQGTLNRIRGSIQFATLQTLNITSPFLAREGISIAFQGDAGELIDTMTGGVTSPQVVQTVIVTAHLLKSQAFADKWKQQIETLVNVGDFTVKNDASPLSDYQFSNGVIMGGDPGSINGTSPDYVVRIKANYGVNSSLYDV